MKKVIVLHNQSLLDISVQEYGTVEAVFELALANRLGITSLLEAGQKLVIPEKSPITGETIIKDVDVSNYYKENNTRSVTVMPIEPTSTALLYGDKDYIANYFE